MEAQLMNLAIETYKITLVLSLPMLLVGLVIGLLISIFQATTQINEMTLTFVPKILAVIVVIIFTMPWMLNMLIDFDRGLLARDLHSRRLPEEVWRCVNHPDNQGHNNDDVFPQWITVHVFSPE